MTEHARSQTPGKVRGRSLGFAVWLQGGQFEPPECVFPWCDCDFPDCGNILPPTGNRFVPGTIAASHGGWTHGVTERFPCTTDRVPVDFQPATSRGGFLLRARLRTPSVIKGQGEARAEGTSRAPSPSAGELVQGIATNRLITFEASSPRYGAGKKNRMPSGHQGGNPAESLRKYPVTAGPMATAQITALQRSGCVRVKSRVWPKRGGYWAIYQPVVERIE